MRKYVLLLAFLLLAGCASKGVKELKQENLALQKKLLQVKDQRDELQVKLAKCNDLAETLEKEKSARNKDLFNLRKDTRNFIKEQFKALNKFSKNKVLLDYYGGELIKRSMPEQKSYLIINAGGPFAAGGIIYEIKGYFFDDSQFYLQIFRKKEEGYLCIWKSAKITTHGPGIKIIELSTPLTVNKQDIFAFYFPEYPNVYFNEQTGNYAHFDDEVNIGENIHIGETGFNYSIGVRGIF